MRYNGTDKEVILDEVFTYVIQEYGCDLEEFNTLNPNDDDFGDELHNLLVRITYDITNHVLEERLK